MEKWVVRTNLGEMAGSRSPVHYFPPSRARPDFDVGIRPADRGDTVFPDGFRNGGWLVGLQSGGFGVVPHHGHDAADLGQVGEAGGEIGSNCRAKELVVLAVYRKVQNPMGEPLQQIWNFVGSVGITAPQVAAFAAGIASIVSIASYRNSRRATRIAEESREEHGRLKSATIRTIGAVDITNNGRKVGESVDLDAPDLLQVATVLTVYSGPDPLVVDGASMVFFFEDGPIFWRRQFVVHVSLGKADQGLNAVGPSLPSKIEAYARFEWRLPFLTIEYGYRKRGITELPPGLLLLGPMQAARMVLIASTAGHAATFSAPVMRGPTWCARFNARSYPFESVHEFVGDATVPIDFRRFLQGWLTGAG